MRRWKLTRQTLLVAMAACLLCFGSAEAKKPDDPGGEGGGGKPGGGDSSDGQVFVNTSDREIWKVEVPSGKKSLVGTTLELFYDIAVSPEGLLYGLTWSTASLYRIDTETAETDFIGELGFQDDGDFNSMDFDAEGNLYVARNRLLKVNPATAESVVLGDTGFEATGDLAVSPYGTILMSSFGQSGIDDLVQLDPETGVGTLIGSIGFTDVYGMDIVGDKLYGITKDRQIITIDPLTGTGSRVRKLGIRSSVYGVAAMPAPAFTAGSIAAVPEPSSITMLGLVLLGLLAYARRWRSCGTAGYLG